MDSSPKPGSRLSSIDALRGAVMIVMALDHVRDFFHIEAMAFSPTDLSRTTPVLFFTRWVTHFCLPVFMFTAGMGVFLFGQRTPTQGQLSRFLWTRGLWFIVLELTVMQLAYNFNFSPRFMVLLLVLWIFGICMIAMAALTRLPFRWLAVLSVAIIAFHNCLDEIDASQFGSAARVWNLLRQPGVISVAGEQVLVSYTFLPWIAVMAAGFCFGRVFLLEPAARQRIMLRTGLALTIAFVVIRAVNMYGDPVPWTHQKSTIFTFLFPRLHQIPCISRLPADDTGAFISRPGLLRSTKVHGRQSPDRLRADPAVLLRPTFLPDTRPGSRRSRAPLRHGVGEIHIQSFALDGWACAVISGGLWLSLVGCIRGVGTDRDFALSTLPTVCKTQSHPERLVVELSLVKWCCPSGQDDSPEHQNRIENTSTWRLVPILKSHIGDPETVRRDEAPAPQNAW